MSELPEGNRNCTNQIKTPNFNSYRPRQTKHCPVCESMGLASSTCESLWPIDSRNTASLERRKAVQLEEDPAGESFQYDKKWSILR